MSIESAKNLMLDSLLGDLKQLDFELELVKKAAEKEGGKNRGDNGKLTIEVKVTVAELKEQKTSNRIINGVKYYNQMDHEKEFIPMEMFTQSAEYQVLGASEKIEEVRTGFSSVLNYFGEDEKMTSADFFGTLSRFLQSFESEKDLFERQEETRIRDEKRAAIQRKKDAKKLDAQRAKEVKEDSESDLSYENMKSSKERKNEMIRSIVNNDTPKGPQNKQGLSATAARLAQNTKKSSIRKEECVPVQLTPANPIGMGGIAAMVAAAARNKKQNANEEAGATSCISGSNSSPKRPANPIEMGGIAAMVAAAARNKKQTFCDSGSNSPPKRPANPIEMGGIAAMAAAAARNKKQTFCHSRSNSPPKRPTNPMGMGGIAAMAAAAARNKMQNTNGEAGAPSCDSGSNSPPKRPTNPTGMGGIAAMAAAAARNKMQNTNEEAGATSRLSESNIPPKRPTNPMGMGGIAAMAAAAARNKMQNTNEEAGAATSDPVRKEANDTVERPADPMGMGGIAAMAAAVARNKKQKPDFGSNSPPKRPTNPIGMGDIAAMAAAAARKKRQGEHDNSNDCAVYVDEEGACSISGESKSFEYTDRAREGISIEGCDSMDSDMSYSASTQHKHSTLFTTAPTCDNPTSGVTHLVRPIARRATNDQMHNLMQQLVEDKKDVESTDSEVSVLRTVSLHESSHSYDTACTVDRLSPPEINGRQTFNSSVLRPKTVTESAEDDSESGSRDEDQVGELPNLQSKKEEHDLDVDSELTMIESKDSNDSDVTYGTISTVDTIQTVQTVQSYARRTNQAFDSLTHRLHGGDQSNESTPSTKIEENKNDHAIGSRPSFNPIEMGGIAAQAAAAALKRSEDKEAECPIFIPLARSGIAALAAAAARKRFKQADAVTSYSHDCRDDDSTSSLSTKSVGHFGIVEQVASARTIAISNTSDIDGTMLGKKD
jgi:hypothetical protein